MKNIFSALLLICCLGCGGPHPITEVGNPTVSVPPVAGTVTKGPVNDALVTVYKLNSDGQLGDVLFTTRTNSEGKFTITAALSGPFAVVATGGSYKDEATSKSVSISDKQKLTMWNANSAAPTTVAVTPLTTIAASRAAHQVANGLEAAIAAAQTEVQKLFGLDGIDLGTTLPQDVTAGAKIDKSRNEDKYGLALAGLTQLVKSKGLQPDQVLDFVNNVAADFADGQLDNKEDGTALDSDLDILNEETLRKLDQAEAEFEQAQAPAEKAADQAADQAEAQAADQEANASDASNASDTSP